MKKYIALILAVCLVLVLSVSAYSYWALSLDCADVDEYEYSETAFYYPDLNVVLDYDPDADMYYFYDTEWEQRIYVPDYVPDTEEVTEVENGNDSV